jgi:hypothetical protein
MGNLSRLMRLAGIDTALGSGNFDLPFLDLDQGMSGAR